MVKTKKPEEAEEVPQEESKWASLELGDEESTEEIADEDMEEVAEMSYFHIWSSIASSLHLIYQELKRTNDYMITGQATTIKITEAPPVFEDSRVPVQRSIPSNLETEKDIISYYRGQLEDVIPEDKISGVEISVEEDKVVLKLPWLEGSWAAVNERLLERLSAERIVDGRNTRYILPRP